DAGSGRPVPRAKATLSSPASTRFACSQPDGRFAFAPLPKGTYTLKVDEPRYVPYALEGVTIASSEARKHDVPLTLGATLSGRVVDEAGAPVADARGGLSREGGR